MDQIVIYPQRFGTTDYLTGDKIEVDQLLKSGALNERLAFLLEDQKKILPLTPENFRMAAARRPAGAPWPPRGFTEAYLLEANLISKDELPGAPPKQKAAAGKPPKAEVVVLKKIALKDDKIAVGPCFVQPKKVGKFSYFDVTDYEGNLLRAKAFRDLAKAKQFLEGLSTEPPTADSPQDEAQAEAADGSDVQPGPDVVDRQDSPEDR